MALSLEDSTPADWGFSCKVAGRFSFCIALLSVEASVELGASLFWLPPETAVLFLGELEEPVDGVARRELSRVSLSCA
jgi:hypothetical protein